MITLQKIGDAIKFTFSGNTHYLQDGTVEVPVNSLSLTIDDSGMATFRKSASNDIFISATYGELGMTKDELVAWYKENMVDGGGSDITSGDVQNMIDESISGKADSSAVTEEISAAVSGKQDTLIAGENITISGNVISAEGGVNVVQTTGTSTTDVMSQDAVTNQLNNKLASVKYSNDSWAGSGITCLMDSNNSSNYSTITFVGSINNKPILTGKDYTKVYNFNLVETSAITTSVTSASTDAQVPSAKAVYDAIQEGGGGNNVVELTQAEYDALVSGGTVDPTAFYIITDAVAFDPSTKVDTSAFTAYSAATDTALSGKADTSAVTESINAAVSGKVDTSAIITSVTSASTDSEIPTAKAVYDAIPQGGGGKAVSGGTNISITTGETADTINCTLPITVDSTERKEKIIFGSDNNLVVGNLNITAKTSVTSSAIRKNLSLGSNNINLGTGATPTSTYNLMLGDGNNLQSSTIYEPSVNYCLINGYNNTVNGANYCTINGRYNKCNNSYETTFGTFNVSNTGSTDADKTIFSLGNGTADNARHNAFEIRQNGDIYITSGGTDIKLQDHLGGGGSASSAITSGDTNAVAGGAVYDKFDEVEQVTAAALNNLNDKFGGLSLVKLTQSAYDALSPNYDNNTLYVIV